MKSVSPWEAFTFGIKTIVKNPFYFLGLSFVTFLFYLVSIFVSFIIVKEFFAKLFIGDLPLRSLTVIFFKNFIKQQPVIGVLLVTIFVVLIRFLFSIISAGRRKIELNFVDTGKSKFNLFCVPFSVILKYFFGRLLYLFIISLFALSVILLFVIRWRVSISFAFLFGFFTFFFFVYLFFKLWLAKYFIIDKRMGVVSAFKNSFFVEGGAWQAFKLYLIFLGFEFLLSLPMAVFFPKGGLLGIFGGLIFLILVIVRSIFYLASGVSYAHLYRTLTRNN